MATWGCYVRVSGAEQVTNNSIPTQQEACHQRARERGATEILDFVDAGVPGDLDWTDRPALNQLLDLVEKKRLVGMVIYDPDRLARDLGVQLAVTEIMTRNRVQLEFCTQQFDASPEGVLFYQLRGAISQFERAKIRERTNRGRKKVLRDGRPANKPAPYGLSYDPGTNTWTVVEDQSDVLRKIFECARQGYGPSSIAQHLNSLGILPPRGLRSTRWWTNTVRRILINEVYTGRLYLHRYNMEGQRKNRFLPIERRVRASQRPRSEWIEVQVPAIIHPELWQAAQKGLGHNRRRQAGISSPYSVYLASRLIRCGVCGSAMTAATATAGPSRRIHYYRCSGRYGERKLRCNMPHLRAEELDAALWRTVRECVTRPEHWSEAARRASNTFCRGMAPPAEESARPLREIRENRAQLEDLIQKGVVQEPEVEAALRNLREMEALLQKRLSPPGTPARRLSQTRPSDLVDLFDFAEQRAFLTGLLSEVIAHSDGTLELVPRE